jgi:hypothetical protein
VVLTAFFVVFGIPPIGSFWMLYSTIRHDENPFPMICLAMVPFSFLWYYFERARYRTRFRSRELH